MNSRLLSRRLISAAAAVTMCVSSAPALYSGSLNVFAEQTAAFDLNEIKDNGIPVLYISIDESAEGFATISEMNESPDHSVMCTGTVRLDVPDGYTGDYSDEVLSDTKELKLEYIRGRGNSTWGAPKKPYKFKLSKSTDLLGMGKNKHWVLLANADDDTLLKNRLTYYIGARLGLNYTPQLLPVDVVMNGEYLGSYYLSEQVRIGNSRVDIDELTPGDNEEPEITGGYLLSFGRQKEGSVPEYRHIVTESGEVFFGEYPEFFVDDTIKDAGTKEQFSYISDYIQKIEDAALSDDFKDKNGVPLSEYLDYEAAASYWWVNSFMKNFDAFSTSSTYWYKERNGKLFYGPLWDFDQSMNSGPDGFETKSSNLWLNRLRTYNKEYQDILLEKWKKLDTIVDDIIKEGGVLDRYKAELSASEHDDAIRWNIAEKREYEFSYDNDVEELREWLKERQQWINKNLDKLFKARCRATFIIDGEFFAVEETDYMKPLDNIPVAPLKDGYVFTGWQTTDGDSNKAYSELTDDITVYSHYIPQSEAVLTDDIYFHFYDVWFDLNSEDKVYSPWIITIPDNPQENIYEWSSSDPTIAQVEANGNVKPLSVGDAVITVKLKNGKEKSYTIHVYDSAVTPRQDITEITCESETITLEAGEYGQITLKPFKQPVESPYLIFDTDAEGVIEILDCGVIHALAPGEVNVKVRTVDGAETSCKVIVKEKSGEESRPDESSQPDESSRTDESSLPEQSSIADSQTESSESSSQADSKSTAKQNENPNTGAAAGTLLALITASAALTVRRKNRQ